MYPTQPEETSSFEEPHAVLYPRGSVDMDVFIKADFYLAFVTGNCVKGETLNPPTAVESTFRSIVSRPIEAQLSKSFTSMLTTVRIDPVTATLKHFWELESIEIVDKDDVYMPMEEEDARKLNGGLKFDGERY